MAALVIIAKYIGISGIGGYRKEYRERQRDTQRKKETQRQRESERDPTPGCNIHRYTF